MTLSSPRQERTPQTESVVDKADKYIAAAEKDYSFIKEKNTSIVMHGRGHLNIESLRAMDKKCENIFKRIAEINSLIKIFKSLQAIPTLQEVEDEIEG